MFKHLIEKLPSGLNLIRVPMSTVSSLTVMVFVNTGSRYEKIDDWGVAHFFEHMVFKGTKKFATTKKLAATIDSIGANFNAFTSKEYTAYYVQAASEHLALSLDVLSDMMVDPLLRSEDIEREKGVIIEELNMYLDTPARHIGDVFEQMMFTQNGLEHDIIGTKESIKNINRQSFLNLLNHWYGLDNLLVVIAGDQKIVESDQTKKLVQEMFSKNSQISSRRSGVKINPYLSQTPYSDQRLKVESKKTEQAHLILGFPGIKRNDPRRFSQALLATVFGGNMSSRLFIEVREKRGLCYYVHSETEQYHDAGFFGVAAGVDPSRVHEAIKVITDQLNQLIGKKQVTEAELAQAKSYFAGKMVLGLEDSASVAQYYGMKQLLLNQIETPEEVLAKIKAISLDEVNTLAQELIQSQLLKLAVIGDFKADDFMSVIS